MVFGVSTEYNHIGVLKNRACSKAEILLMKIQELLSDVNLPTQVDVNSNAVCALSQPAIKPILRHMS